MSISELQPFRDKKRDHEKIVMITAYDFASAQACAAAGADIILVGDSLGFTTLGYQSMTEVTLGDMLHHLKAVKRGAPDSFILCDMPVNTYGTPEIALENAKKLSDAGCHAVKIEGYIPDIVRHLVSNGIPVMGHIGLTPQTLTKYRVHGKVSSEAEELVAGAHALEQAGCFALLLELVFAPLAADISKALSIPTIGIGAGPDTDGQVLVFNDLLGIFQRFKPKFVRRYRELYPEMVNGCKAFVEDVRNGHYPDESESYR